MAWYYHTENDVTKGVNLEDVSRLEARAMQGEEDAERFYVSIYMKGGFETPYLMFTCSATEFAHLKNLTEARRDP